jgi:hypothetical protein
MKGQFRFIIIIVLMMLLIFYTVGRVSTVVYINKSEGIPPSPSTFKIQTPIFYVNREEMLEAEEKTITINSNQLVDAVLTELKAGPTEENLFRVLDEGVQILSSEIVNQKLYLNLSNELVNSTFWQRGYHEVILYSIVNSLTQFDNIERVQIKVEGKDINAYLDEDQTIADLSYNDTLIYREPATPRDVVETFLNYIMIERYDLAFTMTTASESDEFTKSDFEAELSKYRNQKQSYDSNQPFTKRNGNELSVVINYEYIDRVRNITYDGGSEEWFLVEESDNLYKVIWPRLNY